MPKYTLVPIAEKVIALYKENAGEIANADDYLSGIPATLTIHAADENELLTIRSFITHYPSWEIINTED